MSFLFLYTKCTINKVKNIDIFDRGFLRLRSTDHFHIMVDIPEKMIDNPSLINQY